MKVYMQVEMLANLWLQPMVTFWAKKNKDILLSRKQDVTYQMKSVSDFTWWCG